MRRHTKLSGAVVFVLLLSPVVAADDPAQKDGDAKRKELWAALMKAKPKEIERIETYGENPSLTAVCFSANQNVYLFNMKERKVTQLSFMKVLSPNINRIVFKEDKELEKHAAGVGWFELWSSGTLDMVFMSSK